MLGHVTIYTKILASLRSKETWLMEKQRAFRLTLLPQSKNVTCQVLNDFYWRDLISLDFLFYNFQFSLTFRKPNRLPSSGKEMYLIW